MITKKMYVEWIGRALRAIIGSVVEWVVWLSIATLILASAHWLYTN